MKIGYARVSTDDQNLDLQRNALTAADCVEIFTDRISGASARRPGLDDALARCSAGDVLVVWRLDRLGRSLSHLIGLIHDLGRREVGFQSLTESIDTTTAGGRLVFHLMGAIAEFERSLIVERTQAGMVAARKRGVKVGRPTALTPAQIRHARSLIDAGESPASVAATLGVGRTTMYRAIKSEIGLT